MLTIIEILSQNMIWIGLILLSPILYRFAYGIVLWFYGKFTHKNKDIIIKHFHNGKLVSKTVIKADRNKPLSVKKYTE